MGFKHLYLTVALLFVFNRSLHEAQAALVVKQAETSAPHIASLHGEGIGQDAKEAARAMLPYKVHDGDPEEFARIRMNGIQLHAIDVPKTTVGVSDRVRLGLGVFFQREGQIQLKYQRHIRGLQSTPMTRELDLCNQFGWTEPYSTVVEPAMIDSQHVNDAQLLHFGRAEFPVMLPKHMRHDILTVRVPLITDECIKPLGGEAVPDDYEYWLENIENVKNFLLAHDFMGTNVPEGEVAKGKVGKFLMPSHKTRELLEKLRTGKYANTPMPPAISEEDRGVDFEGKLYATMHGELGLPSDPAHLTSMKAAIAWFTRHVNRVLEAKYPGSEFSWFRVNGPVRSNDLEEIHVFLADHPGSTTPREPMQKP